MENNIIDFKPKRQTYLLNEEDIYNMILIYVWYGKEEWEHMPEIDLNVVMQSIEKYRNVDRFAKIFLNLNFEIESNSNKFISLVTWCDKLKSERKIIDYPSKQDTIVILADDEYFNELKSEYQQKLVKKGYPNIDTLMFHIHMDLKHGINNWELLFEDEVIDVPGYPSVITGEFIDQEKDEKVMKMVRKMAIEKLKNLYR